MSSTPTQRIVPGAPPSPAISSTKSSQKRKKKVGAATTAAVDDTSAAPSPLTTTQNLETVPNGVSNQGTPPAPSTPAVETSSLQKFSPTVELIHKRLKATQKKVKRIKDYSSSGTELNADQLRSIASLPALESVVKELEEVKKAIELHESELAKEESAKMAATDEAQKAAITQAVAEAKATSEAAARLLLTFTCLPAMIHHSHPFLIDTGVTETESFAIVSAVETLTGEESQSKEEIISGFFSGEGELQGVAYSRLIEITNAAKNPRQHLAEEGVTESVVRDPASSVGAAETGRTGGLLFVHESELDNEADAPIVGDVGTPPADDLGAPPVGEAVSYEAENALEQPPAEVAGLPQPSGPIDWSAEEEHDLPPISGLQESFGGEPQPTVTVAEDQTPPDDGFTTTHGGRGRGPRGERRGGRGGYRGEGGGRGYGRGGHGDRGGRGSYRGRGDGEYRGRGEGYRGRGDGEWRGRNEGYRGRGDGHDGYRGRGRGRGEGRGGAPPQSQQE